jgi:hypothetical protein
MALLSGGINYCYGSLKSLGARQNNLIIGSREVIVDELILKSFN